MQNGYENIEFITDITWEDLQEIGITKLGKSWTPFFSMHELRYSEECRDKWGREG